MPYVVIAASINIKCLELDYSYLSQLSSQAAQVRLIFVTTLWCWVCWHQRSQASQFFLSPYVQVEQKQLGRAGIESKPSWSTSTLTTRPWLRGHTLHKYEWLVFWNDICCQAALPPKARPISNSCRQICWGRNWWDFRTFGQQTCLKR